MVADHAHARVALNESLFDRPLPCHAREPGAGGSILSECGDGKIFSKTGKLHLLPTDHAQVAGYQPGYGSALTQFVEKFPCARAYSVGQIGRAVRNVSGLTGADDITKHSLRSPPRMPGR